MRMTTGFADRLMLVLLCLTVSLPFLNYLRYTPLPDWWTNAMVLALLSPALLLAACRRTPEHEYWSLSLPRMLPWLLAWWCLAFLPAALRRDGGVYSLALNESLSVLPLLVGAVLLYQLQGRLGRTLVLRALAVTLLFSALLQAWIGVVQLLQLGPVAHGFLMYDQAHTIMGNVAQRNQFAQVLTWGMLAAAYLWSTQCLRAWLALPAMALLALVIAWTGGRLPLAYGGAMLVVAGFWYLRTRDRRLLWPLLSAALLLLLAQLWGGIVTQWLTGQTLTSGFDRLADTGFGERRRIEWHKAWLVTLAHPWFGVGIGGYAYQSAWLEAFGGLGKLPESWLFTHSHNLIMQLLAETGIPATVLAVVGGVLCLRPYLQRRHADHDSAFLLLLATTILGHSMFEYPLWYLPFLQLLLFVLVLSPWPPLQLAVRASLRRTGLWSVLAGCVFYLVSGVPAFWTIVPAQQPVRDAAVNLQRIDSLLQLSGNPFWRYEAELTLANYLVPTPTDVAIKRNHYEQLVRYRPYPMLLCHLAMLRAWDKQPQAALQAMTMAIAVYPDVLPTMLVALNARHDPEIAPLLQLAVRAQLAYQKGGALAAVNQVASHAQGAALPR